MKISHYRRFHKWRNHDGYGYATDMVLKSLKNLGYEVVANDAFADVGFWFDQPWHWQWPPTKQKKIGFHPWESTLLLPDWPGYMNECDEVWTPSKLIKKWYQEYNGIVKPVFVYEHGVDKIWETKPREINGPMKFFHLGGEAKRKELPLAIKAHAAAFGNSKDYELHVKVATWTGPTAFVEYRPFVRFLNGPVPIEDLVQMYHDCHVFVYPSWGEGFGFNPLQALSTGMPTICTSGWAPYERFLDPNLTIPSQLALSPWQELDGEGNPTGKGMHPGYMLKPDFDEYVDRLRFIADNYDAVHTFAQNTAPRVQRAYDWDRLTQKAFSALENRL